MLAVFYAPLNFKEFQYACLQEKYAGLAEEHYPDLKRLMYEFENHSPNLLSTSPALVDSPGDQVAPRAPSVVKRIRNSAPNFFMGTPNNTQRSSSRDIHFRIYCVLLYVIQC